MTDFPTPLLNIPIPPAGRPRSIAQLYDIQQQWSRLAGREWEHRRIEPNRVFFPGRPQISDSKGFMQFINPPTGPLSKLFSRYAPLVSFSGGDLLAAARSKRIANKRPTTNYHVPLIERIGNTNTFGKGAGLGIPQPMEPPPNFNPNDNTGTMKQVRFIESVKNQRPVRKITPTAAESDHLPPRKSILRRRA